ncbi:pyruvate kinase [Candidatus Saccharibacteria bacterium]|nr:pyruvate kinase [Candidatus Saccharibacteria bacterium]
MEVIYKRAKILATVGPATDSYEAIEDMVRAGCNGFRLNFSHGDHDQKDRWIGWIRQAAAEVGKPVAILQDIQGPKIRLGDLNDNHQAVKKGDTLTLVYNGTHDNLTIPVQYDLSAKVKKGERIYLFDGKIKTKVISTNSKQIEVEVENDGELMSRKGLNLPDTDFGGDILTKKDFADLEYGASHDIDYVAVSFIQSAADIDAVRGFLAEHGSSAMVVAKIETKAAIEDNELEKIVEASDGVMVARGDLAVEVGAEIVPLIQRRIIGLCQKHAKLSIVATQMMASMVDNPEPTRAEVSDIANATIVGADCLMLSDETANGKYPLEAIASMKRTILYTQEHVQVRPIDEPISSEAHSVAISAAAVKLAKQLHADAIVAETKSGATAMHIAANRPVRPIVSVTSDPRVANQLSLLYANKTFLKPDGDRAGIELAKELEKNGFLKPNATVVVVSGRQPGLKGATDTIRVRQLGN